MGNETDIPRMPQPIPRTPVSDGADQQIPLSTGFTIKAKPKMDFPLPLNLIVDIILSTVALGILTVVVYFALLRTKTDIRQTTPVQTQKTFSFTGKVVYLIGDAWKVVAYRRTEMKEGDILTEGDEIITEKNTRLVLSFEDGSVIRVGEGASVVLSSLIPASMTVQNQRGIVYARVNKDAGHQFAIKAKSYTVTSLGTSFSVENVDAVKVKVYESSVKVTDDQTKSAESTEVKAKQQWQENTQVSKLNDAEVQQNAFLAWSLSQDSLVPNVSPIVTATPSATPITPATSVTPSPILKPIALSASVQTNGIHLIWEAPPGVNISKGVRVIKGSGSNPSYPTDMSTEVLDPAIHSYTWDIKDSATWHFRVCQIVGTGCGVYSNDVSARAPTPEGNVVASQVTSIALKGQRIGDAVVGLTWKPQGLPGYGYAVLWSKNHDPALPIRNGDFVQTITDPNDIDEEIRNVEMHATYYFRVCELLGTTCATYSNEIMVVL